MWHYPAASKCSVKSEKKKKEKENGNKNKKKKEISSNTGVTVLDVPTSAQTRAPDKRGSQG